MGGNVKTEREYRSEFSALDADNFEGAMRVVKRATLSHGGYQHYTTLSNLRRMLDGHSIWLSRLDSPNLNDQNESGKYGIATGWKRSYIGCFSYGKSECAAMWKMYCRPNANAVRILLSPDGMRNWQQKLLSNNMIDAYWIDKENGADVVNSRCTYVKHAGIMDVVYTAVKRNVREDERSNSLYWNGEHLKISELFDWTKSAHVEGFLKDYEWRYERETRLYAIVEHARAPAERLAIKIPDTVFEHMSIVLSPWLKKEEVPRITKRVRSWFSKCGLTPPNIRESYLAGALTAKCWRR